MKKDKTKIGRIFSSNIDQILEEREHLDQILKEKFHKKVTILFTDICGFTEYFDTRGDIEGLVMLKRHNNIVLPIIEDYNGKVVEIIGDAVMAAFANPIEAVQASIAIQNALHQYNSSEESKDEIHVKIGINTGKALVKKNGVSGDVVNVASRIQSQAGRDQILIPKIIYDQIFEYAAIVCKLYGAFEVKGKSQPVELYEVIWKNTKIAKKAKDYLPSIKKQSLVLNITITCVIMTLIMPVSNHFRLNLLTKIWQCRLLLLPNAGKVVIVTIDKEEHKKMNIVGGRDHPPPIMDDPKMWRKYHSKVIKQLFDIDAGAIGFDLWFSPPNDEPSIQATKEFVEGLVWAKKKNFPIIIGQHRNSQDPNIYNEADWGFISVYKDIGWTDNVKYLKSWEDFNLFGVRTKIPAFSVQVLAKRLGLKPELTDKGVELIGKPIPRRLWLAFAETPFLTVPYHEVFNGWVDKKKFSGKIVLIGLKLNDADYFSTPYSPTDFTPNNKKDSYGMPGVFLHAHAINQMINGYYFNDVNDEWSYFAGSRWYSMAHFESIFFLLIESIFICLLLELIDRFINGKKGKNLTFLLIITITISIVIILTLLPLLIGLANFAFASITFYCVKLRFTIWNFIKKTFFTTTSIQHL